MVTADGRLMSALLAAEGLDFAASSVPTLASVHKYKYLGAYCFGGRGAAVLWKTT